MTTSLPGHPVATCNVAGPDGDRDRAGLRLRPGPTFCRVDWILVMASWNTSARRAWPSRLDGSCRPRCPQEGVIKPLSTFSTWLAMRPQVVHPRIGLTREVTFEGVVHVHVVQPRSPTAEIAS